MDFFRNAATQSEDQLSDAVPMVLSPQMTLTAATRAAD